VALELELYELVLKRPRREDEVVPFEYEHGLGEGDTFERDGVRWLVLERLGLPEEHKEAAYRLACREAS
jgi:hypothetical protein